MSCDENTEMGRMWAVPAMSVARGCKRPRQRRRVTRRQRERQGSADVQGTVGPSARVSTAAGRQNPAPSRGAGAGIKQPLKLCPPTNGGVRTRARGWYPALRTCVWIQGTRGFNFTRRMLLSSPGRVTARTATRGTSFLPILGNAAFCCLPSWRRESVL